MSFPAGTYSSYVVISRFEDIESWRRARELGAEVYSVSTRRAFSKDFGLCDQIQRASVSIMANVVEGYGRNGATEFIRFLTIAQSSAIESSKPSVLATRN